MLILLKAHVKAYTKTDGTFVAQHEDKRPKKKLTPAERAAKAAADAAEFARLKVLADVRDADVEARLRGRPADHGEFRAHADDQAEMFDKPKLEKPPLSVSYGVGVDSTAMLVAMHQRGIRPDAILFADPGGEKPETYAFIPVMQAWLEKVGFPPITTVRYTPVRAPYETLEGKCLNNETLPSLAFGGHDCSQVFKAAPQDKWVRSWELAKRAWAGGSKVVRAIGYDNGDRDRARRNKGDVEVAKKAADGDRDADQFEYWYPLQAWGIDRPECLRLIESAGLPVPMKSACWFCPASKKSEIVWLRDTHPILFDRAVAMENRARDGKHGLGPVKGLGRNFAWGELVDVAASDVHDSVSGPMRKAVLMFKASTHTMFAPAPTDAQKASGRYRKLPLEWHGLKIQIEHPEGHVREGVDETGKPWRTVFRYAYGEIRGTEGMDGDPVDVFVGQHPGAAEVYIVQQMRRKAWHEQDEEKCMLNFASIDEARTAYLEHYDDPRFFGGIRAMPVAEFVRKVQATRDRPGMVKAHISGYTKQDGTFVAQHDDKRKTGPLGIPLDVDHQAHMKAHWGASNRLRIRAEAARAAGDEAQRDRLNTESRRYFDLGMAHQEVYLAEQKATATKAKRAATIAAKNASPTYVHRKVLNGQALHDWASSQGFKNITPPDKMHVTAAYSKAPVDRARLQLDPNPLTVRAGGQRLMRQIGDDGAVALRFDHPHLQNRWQHMVDAGASWDFGHTDGAYLPHATISYTGHDDMDSVQPYDGPLELGPELAEDLRPHWRPTTTE